MNSVITVLYFNGRVYEENDGVIFEGSKKAIQIKREISFNALKKKIGDKVKLENNEIISAISCRFLVSGKYVALQICDDEDVETMLESFQQQDQMSVLELYIKKDVVDGSMFHSANSLTSCGNILQRQATRFEVSTLSSSWASNGMMLGSSSKTKTKVCQGQRILKAQSS